VRLKFQKQSALKVVSRIIPVAKHPEGYLRRRGLMTPLQAGIMDNIYEIC